MVDLRKANCLRVVQSKSLSGDRLDAAVLSCQLIHVSLMVQVFAIEVQGGCLTVGQDSVWLLLIRKLRVALIVLVRLLRSLSLPFGTTSPSLPTSSR